jgi:hypothetical protein
MQQSNRQRHLLHLRKMNKHSDRNESAAKFAVAE